MRDYQQPNRVIRISRQLCGVGIGDLIGWSHTRMPIIVTARLRTVAALREFSGASFPEIANHLGTAHSSCHHAYKRFMALDESERTRWFDEVEAAIRAEMRAAA